MVFGVVMNGNATNLLNLVLLSSDMSFRIRTAKSDKILSSWKAISVIAKLQTLANSS